MPGSGLEIYIHPPGTTWYVRRYDAPTARYIRQTTGKKDEGEAMAWVLSNLQSIFEKEVEKRGGGNYSITRQISAHLDYIEQRHTAGEIAESSLTGYRKSGRHWIRWFSLHGIKKLGDLKNNTLRRYALDRVNKDGFAVSTVNLEVVYIRMFVKWLQEEEIINRPINCPGLRKAIENRTQSEPFAPGDLKKIHSSMKVFVEEKEKKNFGNNSVSKYNKLLFKYFIMMLEESGARQHELLALTWKEVKITETLTNRKRIINFLYIPHVTKKGFRRQTFRGESLFLIDDLQRKMIQNRKGTDLVFRNQQTDNNVTMSTFARYWRRIRSLSETSYTLHTFRSHRITQLVMGGTETTLIGRNLGLSLKQIESSYLRYAPAEHWEKLIQKDIEADTELRTLMAGAD